MRQYIAALMLMFFSFSVHADQVQATPSASVHATTSNVELVDRVSRLENQFTIVRDYDNEFISIVLWSLGTVLTITLVLIGFNWFQSNRALKNEIESLRGEIKTLSAAESASLGNHIDTRLSELDQKLRNIAAEVIQEDLRKLKVKIYSVEISLMELQFKSYRGEVDNWLTGPLPVPVNAVTASGNLLECAINLGSGYEFRISEAIDKLNLSLNRLVSNSDHLDADDIAELQKVIEKIPDDYKIPRAALLARLVSIHK